MSSTRGELWLVRHGETEWSLSGKHTGRTDVPLTPRGEERAVRLGRSLAPVGFARVLSSPLRRALDTARLAGFDPEIHDQLCEWDYGVYEGLTTAEIRKGQPGWSVWNSPVPEGESLDQVARRAAGMIDEASASPGDVAIFAHGHLLRILTACWLGLEPGAGRLFALGPGAVSILGHEHERRVIRRWNLELDSH
jgi:probable phosphoglycerate mutase